MDGDIFCQCFGMALCAICVCTMAMMEIEAYFEWFCKHYVCQHFNQVVNITA